MLNLKHYLMDVPDNKIIISMKDILKMIEEQIIITKNELSSKKNIDKVKLIQHKKDLESVFFLIDIFDKFNINKNNILDVFSLPILEDHFSEYRIMNDKETENRQLWIELDNNKRLYPNDVIIKLKQINKCNN